MSTIETYERILSEWLILREESVEQFNQVSQQFEEASALAASQNQPAPQAPRQEDFVLPEIPPAFSQNFMPEWDGDIETLAKVLVDIFDESQSSHKWLKEMRSDKEDAWRRSTDYYEMASELAVDKNRKKSIRKSRDKDFGSELDPERSSVIFPLAYEAVQILAARMFTIVRGFGSDFVELIGVEPADIENAKIVEKFLNFQQRSEIETSSVLMDWLLQAFTIGTGVIFQSWDAEGNLRNMEAIDRWMVWANHAPTLSKSNVLFLRREMTVGKLKQMRDEGLYIFDDDALDAALNAKVDFDPRNNTSDSRANFNQSAWESQSKKSEGVDEKYRSVYVDIKMDTMPDRWVYVLNEKLIIGVSQPLIPNAPELSIKARFPITFFSPIRKIGDFDGDSFLLRAADPQDIVNSMLEEIVANTEAAGRGFGITTDPSLAGKPMEAGIWNLVEEIESMRIVNIPDVSQNILGTIDWLTDRVTDRTTGINEISRGRAQFSGQTATATRDLLSQSQQRSSPTEVMAVDAMRDVYSVAITLARLYLQPHKLFKITGQGESLVAFSQVDGSRPLQASDLIGISGQDLIPTGLPGSSSSITERILNESAVVVQTGGNPQPLMRTYFKVQYGGRVNVDDIYPANGIGNDPFQENDKIKRGQPVQRDPDDDDNFHLTIHLQLAQDVEFQNLLQQNPLLLNILQLHIQAHVDAVVRSGGAVGQGGGLGSGTGAAGLNLNIPGPDPQTSGELEAQLSQLQGTGA